MNWRQEYLFDELVRSNGYADAMVRHEARRLSRMECEEVLREFDYKYGSVTEHDRRRLLDESGF